MTRRARLFSESGYYHIIMRGNNKNKIFGTKEDKVSMRHLLLRRNDKVEESIEIIAWCLMDNHIHIVLKTESMDLSHFMKKINIKYAMRYHKNHNCIGHVFQDRYKSKNIESEDELMRVVRYVHLNPVKANIAIEPSKYEWSSYNAYLDKDENEDGLSKVFVLKYCNQNREAFKSFHMVLDLGHFLEIKEDMEKYRIRNAHHMIDLYYERQRKKRPSNLKNDSEHIEHIIGILKSKSGLSLRKISELIGVSVSKIYNIKVDE